MNCRLIFGCTIVTADLNQNTKKISWLVTSVLMKVRTGSVGYQGADIGRISGDNKGSHRDPERSVIDPRQLCFRDRSCRMGNVCRIQAFAALCLN